MPAEDRPESRAFAWIVVAGALTVAAAADEALAGDVTVTRKGKKVTIAAGDGDESITIEPSAGNVLRIASNDETTTVDGGTEAFVTVGSRDTVVVQLGNGSNRVDIQGVFPRIRQLTVKGGTGNDYVSATTTLPSALRVETGGGPGSFDFVGLSSSVVSGKVLFVGGDGQDSLYAGNSEMKKGLKATMGNDDPALQGAYLGGCTTGGPVVLLGGSGPDSFIVSNGKLGKAVTVKGNGGDDSIIASGGADFMKPVRLQGNDGDDLLVVSGGPDFTQALTVDGGAGDDSIEVSESGLYKGAKVLGGEGNDSVALSGFTTVGVLQVLTGGGDDYLAADTSTPISLRTDATFDGGKGSDTLVGGSEITLPAGKHLSVRKFEFDH